jgi:hypothetical protein
MDKRSCQDVGRLWKMMEVDGRGPRGNQIRFSSWVEGRRIESRGRKMAPNTDSFSRLLKHVESNLREGISNLRERKSNLRIFDINLATKFEYWGKSNLVAPEQCAPETKRAHTLQLKTTKFLLSVKTEICR